MSATSFLMVMAMLALVLGAMGIAMRVLRRYAVTNATSKGNVKMQVIQRLSLGQRQGLAVVRVGNRVLAVSMGDGGVHQVAELSEDDLAAAADGTTAVASSPMRAITDRFRRLALVRGTTESSSTAKSAAGRAARTETHRISYIAPIEDFQTVLNMALGGARA